MRRGMDGIVRASLAVALLAVAVAVVIGALYVGWSQVALWWRTDGPDGPHWGKEFVCTEYREVFVNRWVGTEDECVAGYWVDE